MSRLTNVRSIPIGFSVAILSVIVACGSTDGSTAPDEVVDSGGPTFDSGSGDVSVSDPRDASTTAMDAGSSVTVADPAKDGPYTLAESDVSVDAATGDTLTMHVVVPSAGPTTGPFPIVFIGAGYQIPTDQYYGYAKRLATHGIVGVTVGFPQAASDQLKDAKDLQAALDWASAPGAALAAVIDATRPGVMGHSRGGKAAVLAAVRDTRFKGVLGLDPVDSVPSFVNCDPVTECPDASDAMATAKIPSGFLGETLDETGFLMACAAAADNYSTFYASAPSPTFAVTISGAGHMSFIADRSSTILAAACKTPTVDQSVVLDLAYAYTAAFFLRNLEGKTAYDSYLVGPIAMSRYVTPGIATLDSK